METVRMLLFTPHKQPKVIRVDNEHDAIFSVLKKHNSGCFDAHAMKIEKNIYIIYPKLEDILEYGGTRKYESNVICGTFLIAKTDDSGLIVSVDYRNLLKYAHKFWDNSSYDYSECLQGYYNLAFKELDDTELI
ncbi:MAG: hypothetical protein IJM98_08705 [Oscillospiraceae bacterium]|nr:hypothetical protein [Oscillospiraceae bacterium]